MRDVVYGVGVVAERVGGEEMQEPEERDQVEDVEEGFEGDDGALRHFGLWSV